MIRLNWKRTIWCAAIIIIIGITCLVVCTVGVECYSYLKYEAHQKAVADSLNSENANIREQCALNMLKRHSVRYTDDKAVRIIEKSNNPYILFDAAKSVEQYNNFNAHPYGKSESKDAYKMAFYYMLAAEKGHPTAQAEFSRCLMNGFGVSRNCDLAFSWANKSAATNDSVGIYALAMCKAKGYGTDYDPDSAVILLRKSALTGYERAQQKLMIELPNVPRIDYDAH